MDGENVSYDPAEGDKPMFNNLMFNNPKLSDVRFLVEGQTLYGHKYVLSRASPVLESMFFGELKEQREVIEIKDLTLVGFKNALRYIYGYPIDYELSELYESYMAADMYLLHRFGNEFFDYVKSKLDVESSCLIYDQLVKIGDREEIRLDEVRSVIIENSRETIGSEHFTQIDQETLISLLSLDRLNIDEDDLLAAVLKWVDCEVQRQGLPVNHKNRLRVFEPIKSYLLFSSLTPEKAAKCKEITELLTLEEIGSLLVHLNHGKPFMIELKTSRSAGAGTHSVFVNGAFSGQGYPGTRSVYLTVNRRISIRAIHLTYSPSAPVLTFSVRKSSENAYLGLNVRRSMKDGKLLLSLSLPLEVEANKQYRLFMACSGTLKLEDELTEGLILSYGHSSGAISFTLSPLNDYNFVRGLDFVPLD